MKNNVFTTVLLLFSCPIFFAQDLPFSANTYFNIARKHINQGNQNDALLNLERAIEVNPDHFEALFHLANNYFSNGQFDKARKTYQKATEVNPNSQQTFFNLALVLESSGQRKRAFEKLERSLDLNPNYSRARRVLANLLVKENRYDEAVAHYNYILQHEPKDFDTQFCVAEAYRKKSEKLSTKVDLEQAAHAYAQALEIKPYDKKTLFSLAYTYRTLAQLEDALVVYDEILSFDPACVDAMNNKAHLLRDLGDTAEAAQLYETVLQFWPDNAHAHYGYAESLLREGDLQNGFAEFEWRWKRDGDKRNFSEDLWNGQTDIAGKTILIRAEYGLGDTMQFVRFAKTLKDAGAMVAIELQRPLKALFACNPYIDEIVEIGQELPDFDLQIPVMSLPHVLNATKEEDLDVQTPYFELDDQLVNAWKQKIAPHKSLFKIGICWEGSTYYDGLRGPRSKKALHLSQFAPLAHLPNVKLFSLQKGGAAYQVQEVDFDVCEYGPDFDESRGGFIDTAALMPNLDLIITIDTSVAHLAGALGVPVFVILPQVADWRWMKNRSDSPWYPTMRLFRQETFGDWTQVFQKLADSVAHAMNISKARADIVSAEISVGELIDKITILQLKNKYITNEAKLKNVRKELEVLCKTRDEKVPSSPALNRLTKQLYDVNQALWDIEDDCRDKERNKEFDDEFIQITRSVYITNDKRCALKREINELLGSNLIEEKSYAAY